MNIRKHLHIPLPVLSERNHLLLMVALSFLTGCLSITRIAVGVWLWAVLILSLALAAALKAAGFRAGLAIALCSFSLGALYAHAAFDLPMPAEGRYEITATVYGGVTPRTDRRLSFALTDVLLDGEAVEGKGYCSLHYEEEPPVLFDGARIRFQGRVYHPDGPSGAPHTDFRMWMRQQGLSFGIAAYQDVQVENTPDTAPWAHPAFRVQQALMERLEQVMGENSRVAAALLLGEKDGLTERETLSFQTLGIAHVMSVSGLHVGLVGGLLLALLGRLQAGKRLQLVLVTLLVAGYCAVTGFSAAANRAAVMLILTVIASMIHRHPDWLTVLAAAMLIVLVINPLHAFSAGFVLSFSAMLGIHLFLRPLLLRMDRVWPPLRAVGARRRRLQRLRRLQQGFKSVLATALTAQLGVLIPTAVYFHQLPLYGILINLLIVPLVSSVLVPLYALSLLPLVGLITGPAASLATDLLLWLVRLLSALPCAAVRVGRPPDIAALGLGLALVMLSRRVPGTLRRRICAAALTAVVALGSAFVQRPAELRYIQLAVGQADSALLMDGGKTVLIDTGVDSCEAIDYLLDENRHLDALILTHLHTDHAGGVSELLNCGIRIGEILIPVCGEEQRVDPLVLAQLDHARSEGIPVRELASGDELRYNKAGIRILWPERDTVRIHQDANAYPLVMAIDLDGYTLLQMSDMVGAYERYASLGADVLKMAHHGSADSTREAFLSAVSPSAAILSCTSSSRSLPGPEALSRLESSGIPLLRTDEAGDITLSVRDGQLFITPYKERNVP